MGLSIPTATAPRAHRTPPQCAPVTTGPRLRTAAPQRQPIPLPFFLQPISLTASLSSRALLCRHGGHPRVSQTRASAMPPPTATPTPTPSPPTPPPPAPISSTPNRWLCVSAASIVHALHATAVYMAPTTLLSPMRDSLHLSVEEITRPLIAFRAVQAIFLIPAGVILDSVGPQLCLRLSMTLAALLVPFLPLVSSLSQLMWLQSLCGITKLFGGLSAMVMLANMRFPDGKGLSTATGLILSGYSFAGFLAPAVIGSLSQRVGWRIATAVLSALFVVVALPMTYLYLTEPREKHKRKSFRDIMMRLRDRSGMRGHGKVDGKEVEEERLVSPAYGCVAVAVAAFSFTMNVMFDHLVVFLREDFGMAFGKATVFMSALNLAALFAKLVVGPLADRVNKSKLMAGFGVVGLMGSLLMLDFGIGTFAVTSSIVKVGGFVVLCTLPCVQGLGAFLIADDAAVLGGVAISYASIFSLTTMFLPEFGTRKLGLRSNLNLMILFATGSIGSYAAAQFRSVTGTYKWPFLWNVLCFGVVTLAGIIKYLRYDRHSRSGMVISQASSKQKAQAL